MVVASPTHPFQVVQRRNGSVFCEEELTTYGSFAESLPATTRAACYDAWWRAPIAGQYMHDDVFVPSQSSVELEFNAASACAEQPLSANASPTTICERMLRSVAPDRKPFLLNRNTLGLSSVTMQWCDRFSSSCVVAILCSSTTSVRERDTLSAMLAGLASRMRNLWIARRALRHLS